MIQVIFNCAEFGQPIFMTAMALAGATAPATLAGLLVQQNAEILSGLLMANLINPRTPVIYGSMSCIIDMKTTIASVGSPEQGLISVAAAQMAHFYGIPCSVGAESDSKIPDAQASYEKAMSLTMAVMAGTDLMDLSMGSIEAYNTTSFEQMVIDNEIAGMALRSAEGIEVNDETLAINVINRVGPGGNYLVDKHTLNWFKKEYYKPTLSNRETRSVWEKSGSKDIRQEARKQAKKILAEHEPEPIDKTCWKEITEIIKEVEKRER
jgi:trimethylamine--corrinoid protein Co-methyltransferase